MNYENYRKMEESIIEDERNELNFFDKEFPFSEIVNEILENYKNNKLDIFMVYQPYASLDSGKCRNAEALLRVRQKIDGFYINPMVFIRIIEQALLLNDFNIKQIAVIARDTKFFKAAIDNKFRVSINISANRITPIYYFSLFRQIEENKLGSYNLAIEILEDCKLDASNTIFLKRMQEFGIKIYLDDFGRGFSDYLALKKFPFNIVKISDSLIQDIDIGFEKQKIVKQIVDYCKTKGIRCIAEHVETQAELDFCKKVGVNGVQGYYFSKPVLPEQLVDTCRKIKQDLEIDLSQKATQSNIL